MGDFNEQIVRYGAWSLGQCMDELDRLRAEVDHVRPVYEAAKAWRTARSIADYGSGFDRMLAVIDSVLAKEKSKDVG